MAVAGPGGCAVQVLARASRGRFCRRAWWHDDRRPLGGVRRPVPRSRRRCCRRNAPNWGAIRPRALAPSHGRANRTTGCGLKPSRSVPQKQQYPIGLAGRTQKPEIAVYHPERPARGGPAGMQPQAAHVTSWGRASFHALHRRGHRRPRCLPGDWMLRLVRPGVLPVVTRMPALCALPARPKPGG